MITKELGKIEHVSFGLGGYQDVCFGLTLSFAFGKTGNSQICEFISGGWDVTSMKCDKDCKWTEEDRNKNLSDMCRRISKILSDAKISEIYKLKGIPVEIEMEDNGLKSWRVLTEVL